MTRRRAESGAPYFALGLAAFAWAATFGTHVTARQNAEQTGQTRSADQLARQVYTIFEKNCFDCHAEFGESGLDLRTEATLQKGGTRGKVVVAHNPSASRLYRSLTHQDDLKMPDGGPKLSDADIETVRLWIMAGASLASVKEAAATEGPSCLP